jgi:hypothetical protein
VEVLELSLIEDDESSTLCVGNLPLFGNLRALRVYAPAFGSELAAPLTRLLRHNLQNLQEFACVAHTSPAPSRSSTRPSSQAPLVALYR